MYRILADLTSKVTWLAKRDVYMEAARECKNALTIDRPYSFTSCGKIFYVSGTARYSGQPEHPNVKAAVSVWVAKAKRAHAIAMGREAVIENAIFINNQQSAEGGLYV